MTRLRYFIVLCATMLAACAGVKPQAPGVFPAQLAFESDRFGEVPDIVEANAIFQLTHEQQRHFLRYFHDSLRWDVPANQSVFDYLESVTIDFTYDGETLTASETLERGKGNCLSLAILTTALAQLVDVEVGYQLTDSAPVFQSQGRVIYKGVHARSMLYDPEWAPENSMYMIRRPGIRVDYFPSGSERFIGNLSKGEFIGMYYSNLAADALAAGEYSSAFWLLNKSMEFAPDSAAAINMMAVVYRRVGDDRKAEEIYRLGIEHVPDKVSLLRNYRILLTEQGRMHEADEVGARLDRLGETNPFDWIHAAQQAYNEGRYREALTLFEKAAEVAPYLHESYFGMAKSYFELGDIESAESELKQAKERANRESTRSLYEAKLVALQSSQLD